MVRSEIAELRKFGRMSEDVLDEYIDILDKIVSPLNFDEAEILVTLFPDEDCAEVEWDLIHLIETVPLSNVEDVLRYEKLIHLCPSEEWKSTLLIRLKNWKKKRS